jgi:hypothetical protein
VSIVHFVIGVAALLIGGWMIVGRERIAARARLREGSAIHAPMGYLVLDAMSFLAGVLQLVVAFA